MKKITLLLLFCLVGFSHAQTKIVSSGVVTSDDSESVSRSSHIIPLGARKSTVLEPDKNFQKAKKNGILSLGLERKAVFKVPQKVKKQKTIITQSTPIKSASTNFDVVAVGITQQNEVIIEKPRSMSNYLTGILTYSDYVNQGNKSSVANNRSTLVIRTNRSSGVVSTYSSLATFQANVSGMLVSEDFSGAPAAITICDPVISSAGDSCFLAGELVDGFDLQVSNAENTVSIPATALGTNTFDLVGSASFVQYTIINFTGPDAVFEVAMEVWNNLDPDTDFRLFDTGGVLIDSFNLNNTIETENFIGVISPIAIGSIEIEGLNDSGELFGQLLFTAPIGATACNEENPSNGLENGLLSGTGPLFPNLVCAADITIAADTDFSLTSVNANLGIRGFGETITSSDIVIYGDEGGFPDPTNIIASLPAVVPSSQTIIGPAFTEFEFLDVTFDIPATVLAGQTGATTTYWISIYSTASNAEDVFWEITSASLMGNEGAYSSDNGATWTDYQVGFDFVYNFSGDCSPIGGGGIDPPGCASNPTPVDGATEIAPGDFTFTWDAPASGADSYDLFFGLTPALEFGLITNLTTTAINLLISSDGTTFFWSIVPKNAGGDATGCSVWTFSTAIGEVVDCGTYTSSPSLPILDNSTVTDDIVITRTVGQEISDLDVILDISHSYVGDMTITITSPSATVVTLWAQACAEKNNMSVRFNDAGSPVVCTSAIVGNIIPSEALSAFTGEVFDGTWTIAITDAASNDTGTLNTWCLIPTLEAVVMACNEENPSNGLENGLLSGTGPLVPTQVVATDITIAANTDFSLTSVNANLAIRGFGETITSSDIVIYGDMGGFPDPTNIIASFPAVVPSSQTIIGPAFTVFEFLDVTFDIPATVLAGQTGATTTYWISIYSTASNAEDVFWEITSASLMGNEGAYSSDNGATWTDYQVGFDFVYNFSGECTLQGVVACSGKNPSNGFEDLSASSSGPLNPTRVVAADISIPKEIDFSLTSVNANLGIRGFGETITSAAIVIYGDIGGFPDPANIIASFPAAVPSSQTILGTAFSQFEILDVTFDIPPTLLAGQVGTRTAYWISIYATASNADDVFWEATSVSGRNNPGAVSIDNGVTWLDYLDGSRELVYDFSGECFPIDIGLFCNEENLSNEFEISIPSSANDLNDILAATDITIAADSDFSLTSVNANLAIQGFGETITSADIVIYGDNGGLPDSANIIASFPGLIPTSQTFLGTSALGFEYFDITFNLPATLLTGQVGETTTYWISIYSTSLTAGSTPNIVHWEATSVSIIGNDARASQDNGATWISIAGWDLVYDFSGECMPIDFGGLSIKAYLQGPSLNPNTGEETLMRDDVRIAGLLPIISPYADGLTCDISIFSVTGANAIVDWVWLELRDSTDRSVVVEGRSALIQRDGDIVDIDGNSTVDFMADPGIYYLGIQHRNHLSILSAAPVAINGETTVDLSSDPLVVFGNSNAVADMGGGIFALYAGDFNGDGQILNTDITGVLPLSGTSGYSNSDANMDGQTLNTDIQLIIQPNSGRGIQY